MIKILFMGTPEFAIPSLEEIINLDHKIVGVVTQPDRPKGRGQKISSSPVKQWSIAAGLCVYQPESVRQPEFIQTIEYIAPDLIVTAAFGQIIPQSILGIPSMGCINVHASLMPKYRGASPIQQALIDGQSDTGITIFYMNAGMDTGDIILKLPILIYPEENAGELSGRLACLGAIALRQALELFEAGVPERHPQQHNDATYCKKIDSKMGRINWEQDATTIKNLIRGLTPSPGAFAYLGDQALKICKAVESQHSGCHKPGLVVAADNSNGLVVACGNGYLRLLKVQKPGGRVMEDREFLSGHPVCAGTASFSR